MADPIHQFQIVPLLLNLPVAQSRVGIFVTASDRAHVSGNEVSDVGPQGDFVGPSASISILTPFGGVDIAGNLVRRFSPALGVTTVDSSDWTPVLVLGPAPSETDKTFTAGAASAGRFAKVFVRAQDPVAENLTGIFKLGTNVPTKVETGLASGGTATTPPAAPVAAPVPKPAPIRIAVRGNQHEGYGSQAVALIYGENDCVFAENHCALETPANQTVNSADMVLGAITVIATGNRITGGAVALAILASASACSVVGNLTLGTITVDGAVLAAPWAALNLNGG